MFTDFQPEGLEVTGRIRQLQVVFARDIKLSLPNKSEIYSVHKHHLHKDTVVFNFVEDGDKPKDFKFRIIAPNDGLEAGLYHKFIGSIINEFEYSLSVFQLVTVQELLSLSPTEFDLFTQSNPIHRQQIEHLRYDLVDL